LRAWGDGATLALLRRPTENLRFTTPLFVDDFREGAKLVPDSLCVLVFEILTTDKLFNSLDTQHSDSSFSMETIAEQNCEGKEEESVEMEYFTRGAARMEGFKFVINTVSS